MPDLSENMKLARYCTQWKTYLQRSD